MVRQEEQGGDTSYFTSISSDSTIVSDEAKNLAISRLVARDLRGGGGEGGAGAGGGSATFAGDVSSNTTFCKRRVRFS